MSGPIVLAYIDEPPFCFPVVNGAEGYDVEVALCVLAAMGVREVEARLVTFADLLTGLVTGRWRINTPLFVTPERQDLVLFSRGVWALADGLLVRAGDVSTILGYEALVENRALRLVVVAGQVQEHSALKAGLTSDRILRVVSPEQAVEAVVSGQADAYASVARAHRGFLQREPDPTLAVVDLDAAKGPSPAVGAYGFAKRDGAFRDVFDIALNGFLGSPDHRGIMDRYGFVDADMYP